MQRSSWLSVKRRLSMKHQSRFVGPLYVADCTRALTSTWFRFRYFEMHGISLAVLVPGLDSTDVPDAGGVGDVQALSGPPTERSATMILVKNIPQSIKEADLQNLFSRFVLLRVWFCRAAWGFTDGRNRADTDRLIEFCFRLQEQLQ